MAGLKSINQPVNFKFPKRSFGKKNPELRSFNPTWFKQYAWLHYDEAKDLAFCFTCMVAAKEGKISNFKADGSFISTGFCNWKDATSKFRKHQDSDCHKEAVERKVKLPRETKDIGEVLSAAHSEEKAHNRQQLLTILRNIRFLVRQGLPLRGHDNDQSNFLQLLKLHGESDPSILKWLERKQDKFTSADIQNEMLQVMALKILRDVASNIRENGYFSIMVDETTDQSNREQVVIVIRHVDSNLDVHEEFIGLCMVPSIDAATLTNVILDALVRMNISLSKCRGQCYDGASNMSGAKKGVAANITSKETRAIYTHCYGHALNLAVGDTVKKSKVMRDSLDTVFEMSKLVKYSPRRDTILEQLKREMAPDTPGFRVLCPTRWTVRAASLNSVLENYSVLQSLWETCYECTKDPEARSRIIGVKTQMQSFDFLFVVSLGYEILRHTDNLSRTLQKKDLSAAEGQHLTDLSLTSLSAMRKEESFDSFWESLNGKLNELDVSEPTLPRRRKMPKRYETGKAPPEFTTSEKDLYRQQYFEALDLVVNCVKDRFDQPGYQVYRHLEDVLLKSVRGDKTYKEDLDFVLKFYGDDLDKTSLSSQLDTFTTLARNNLNDSSTVSVSFLVTLVSQMSPASRCLFSEIVTLLRLILVMPATNATSERTFSALRRVKTYLRATMSQERLNHLMILHTHREATDALNILAVANDFVSARDGRSFIFGRF
ncbi:zinc finger MYM-type protein 1-like [Saccostrea cucullata]|uniref:zinc finger MYM-type protein 1-like n=1 Tax=Saccostrea cuccullata TaxID=36930 RepID=UPI002ED28079